MAILILSPTMALAQESDMIRSVQKKLQFHVPMLPTLKTNIRIPPNKLGNAVKTVTAQQLGKMLRQRSNVFVIPSSIVIFADGKEPILITARGDNTYVQFWICRIIPVCAPRRPGAPSLLD